jgi:hypothetical protein
VRAIILNCCLFSGFFNSVLFIAGIPNFLHGDTHSNFYSYFLDFLKTQSHHTLILKLYSCLQSAVKHLSNCV